MKNSLKYFVLFAFLWSFGSANAQISVKLYEDTAYTQRLLTEFDQATQDSVKADLAFRLAYTYKRMKEVDKAQAYLAAGNSLVGDNPLLQGTALYYQGYLRLGTPEMAQSANYARQADSVLAPLKQAEAYRIRSNTWMMRGILLQLQGDEKQAMEAYIDHALPLAKQSKNAFIMGMANKFVGISLLNAEEREKANSYLRVALSNFEKAQGESKSLQEESIVEVLLILAENNVFMDNLEAKHYLDQASAILQRFPHSNAYLFYYLSAGKYEELKGHRQQALAYYDKGIHMQADLGESHYINRIKYVKFDLLRKMGRDAEAIALMRSLLDSDYVLFSDRNRYYNLLAETYAHAGDMQAAYRWSQQYISASDSIHRAQNKAAILELEKKYQTAEKEKQITRLHAEKKQAALTHQNQRLLNWLLGTGAAIFLFALLAARYAYRNKQRRTALQLQEMEKQKELDLTQAMLDGEERERKRIARDLHDGLGGSLAGIKLKLGGAAGAYSGPLIEETVQRLDASINELRRIARNMMPESLLGCGVEVALRDLCIAHNSKQLKVHFQSDGIAENLSMQTQVNIYRIIQELLNNAIRHGQATEVIVQCTQHQNQILMTVEDNGKGFDLAQASNGMGLHNIQTRVKLLKGSVQLESAPNEGTSVNIELRV